MSNPFKVIGDGIADVAKALAAGVARIFGLARKVEYILKQEKPLEKPFIDGLVNVVADVEALLGDSQTAVTDGGLNFPADSAAYQAFLKLYADVKALLPLVEDQLAVLEGKALPYPLNSNTQAQAPDEPAQVALQPVLNAVSPARTQSTGAPA